MPVKQTRIAARRFRNKKLKEMPVRVILWVATLAAVVAYSDLVFADGPGDPAAVKEEDGKYQDKEGNPTFKSSNGSVDWYTYSGFRRYHSECHVCHGPDGEGSSYAPALKNSVKALGYGEFLEIVASGRKNVNSSHTNVMPAFGDNPNVACYIDDIYVYLRARGADAVGRVRPDKHDDKPPAAQQAEDSCMGKK
jgi:methanol metabolism-related c-type cytochrome